MLTTMRNGLTNRYMPCGVITLEATDIWTQTVGQYNNTYWEIFFILCEERLILLKLSTILVGAAQCPLNWCKNKSIKILTFCFIVSAGFCQIKYGVLEHITNMCAVVLGRFGNADHIPSWKATHGEDGTQVVKLVDVLHQTGAGPLNQVVLAARERKKINQ